MKPLKLLKIALALIAVAAPLTAQTNAKVQNLTALQCLTANLYFEARGEKPAGMQAVADVTVNRMLTSRFPATICGVVFQRKQFSWTHQQAWSKIDKILTGQVKNLNKLEKIAYNKSKQIAEDAMNGVRILPESSLHYHATYVKPKWSAKMKKYATIGSHVFYRS